MLFGARSTEQMAGTQTMSALTLILQKDSVYVKLLLLFNQDKPVT